MDQYVNPFSITQHNAIPNNPFMSGMIQQQTQQQAQPFIDMAQQSRGLSLDKQRIETGEFADPRAVNARMSGHDLTTATNQSKLRMMPKMEEAEMRRIDEEIRALPHMTDQKIAQAQEITRNARSAPHREMLANLGQLYPILQKATDQEKPFLYLSAIERMKQLGIKVPQQFTNYDPRHLNDLAAIYHAQIYTPEQIGKERITDMQGRNNLDVQALRNEGQLAVAQTSAEAHVKGASIRNEAAETPQKAVARLRRELRAKPGDPDAASELSGYLNEEFDKRFQRDSLGQMLQIQAMQNKDKMAQYLTYREQQKARLFLDEGLFGEVDAQGRDWVLRAIEANPNMGLQNIITEGRKRKKIK